MNILAEKIAEEIKSDGPMTFARFMERALYEPELGYYERLKNIGRRGDFFTSVSVGSLFGELLALQFVEWLEELQIADCGLRIVEAGAHDGNLAKDILCWLQKFRGKICEQTEYHIIEPSARRQVWQKENLKELSQNVRWHQAFEPNAQFTIIFSNELLDAFPVHRLCWASKTRTWREWLINSEGKGFSWVAGDVSNFAKNFLPEVPPELAAILPDGFTTEVSPTAVQWWKDAANGLKNGKILTIDYGLLAEEFFQPQRSRGTLRTFSRHQAGDDLLASPGDQDITAHVNFSALRVAGEEAGLRTDGLIPQAKFLATIAEKTWKSPEQFGNWSAQRVKQFQTLTHPEHLGRSFRVLIQSRGSG